MPASTTSPTASSSDRPPSWNREESSAIRKVDGARILRLWLQSCADRRSTQPRRRRMTALRNLPIAAVEALQQKRNDRYESYPPARAV
ncbi:hypothetical protein GCM10027408_24220 [Microbacterium tumbae]